MLTLKPESSPNRESSSKRPGREMVGYVRKNIRSSAYAATQFCLPTRMPLMSKLDLTRHRKDSSSRMKIRGDKGHPCVVTFYIMNDSDTFPLTITETVGEVYKAIHVLAWHREPPCNPAKPPHVPSRSQW